MALTLVTCAALLWGSLQAAEARKLRAEVAEISSAIDAVREELDSRPGAAGEIHREIVRLEADLLRDLAEVERSCRASGSEYLAYAVNLKDTIARFHPEPLPAPPIYGEGDDP